MRKMLLAMLSAGLMACPAAPASPDGGMIPKDTGTEVRADGATGPVVDGGEAAADGATAVADASRPDSGSVADGGEVATDGATAAADASRPDSGLVADGGSPIPPERMIDWSAAGVVNGIPERTQEILVTGLVGDGVTDNAGVIQAAIAACPVGSVVKIPEGTYACASSLTLKSGITLRGSGVGKTILKSTGAASAYAGFVNLGTTGPSWQYQNSSTAITSGATAGSTTIGVASSASIAVGTHLVIAEENDPALVATPGTANVGANNNVTGWGDDNLHARGQVVRVTAVAGSTLTVSPALYSDYARSPIAVWFKPDCENAGVEDLTLYATNSGIDGASIMMYGAYNCWVRNVFGDFCDSFHVKILWGLHNEVRHSHFRDAYFHAAGNRDNSCELTYKTSHTLVVDNIFERLLCGVMLNRGAAGNVIAYNFTTGEYHDNGATGATWMPFGLGANHGAHPQFNLFEGNVTAKFVADSYWGTSSDTTVLRNWFLGHGTFQPPYSQRGPLEAPIAYAQDLAAIQVWEGQTRLNVVGNVLGDSTLAGATYKVTHPDPRGYGSPYIWSIGYISSSDPGTSTPVLPKPAPTLLDHGNWDPVGNAQRWDPAVSSRSIPASLFLATKPAFFHSLPWPPFDAAQPAEAAIANLPAGYRYQHGQDPP
ncbi:MAG: glycosyl hydrolase family 28-related protein [Myxococcales bacterium]